MRIHSLALLSLAAGACALAQQTGGSVTQVLSFSISDTPQAMQEITNAIRSLAELPQASLETSVRTLTIEAAPSGEALAGWLLRELDTPQASPSQDPQVASYAGLTDASDQLRVFRLANPVGAQPFQELVNSIRVVPDMSKVFPSFAKGAIAVRGTADQLALAEWLFKQLDQPPAAPGQTRAEQQFHSALTNLPEVRVLYFAHASTAIERQPVVNAVRVIPELTHVFPVMAQGAIAMSGPADRIALAEWLFGQVDISAPAMAAKTSAAYELTPGSDVAQVFFLPGAVMAQSFQELAASVKAIAPNMRTFPNTLTSTLAVRGTPAQLAQAGQILKGGGQP
jgi:hypothetical protein